MLHFNNCGKQFFSYPLEQAISDSLVHLAPARGATLAHNPQESLAEGKERTLPPPLTRFHPPSPNIPQSIENSAPSGEGRNTETNYMPTFLLTPFAYIYKERQEKKKNTTTACYFILFHVFFLFLRSLFHSYAPSFCMYFQKRGSFSKKMKKKDRKYLLKSTSSV